ncbi:MAG: hypothetical protein HQL54_11165 [Magnetococcales bacterium]|nr:hypothetical protein [Magnetococcales bacterium]
MVEVHQQEVMASLRKLMVKMYRRNPREFKKAGLAYTEAQIESYVAALFDTEHDWRFAELDYRKNIDSIHLAFNPRYQGDRVFALFVGLGSMIMTSYNDKREFFVLDDLDAQKLYNSARNVEIAIWKLNHIRDEQGALLLLSNEDGGLVRNFSFERLAGKVIALQDAMSKVVATKSKRIIKDAIQFIASKVFLPI